MKKGIRYKLLPRSISKKRSERETKVIVVSDQSYDVPVDLLSSLSKLGSWSERFDLSMDKSKKLSGQYKDLLAVLESDFDTIENVKNAILQYSRQILARDSDQVFSKVLRRKMVGRLTSLLVDFDPMQEIFDDPEVVAIAITDRRYFRIHKSNGTVSTLEWMVNEVEARVLKLVLERMLSGGNKEIPFSSGLIVKLSSLSDQALRGESILLSPMRVGKKSMLDLIRAKVLSPQLARNLSKSILASGTGLLISGGMDTGKSGLLSALISSVANNTIPLIIADNSELKGCHPHAEVISHAEIDSLLASANVRELESNIFRMGARYIFVDDLSPRLYSFLMRVRLVYDIPIIATIPGVNARSYLSYLLQDSMELNQMKDDRLSSDIRQLVDLFPYVISLSRENDKKGIAGIYEMTSAGNSFHLVPVIIRKVEDEEVVWKITEVASSELRNSMGFGM